jgi:hypothetical protein
MFKRSSRWSSIGCMTLLWLPLSASATLGGNAASVDADRVALAATASAAPSASSAMSGANATAPVTLPGATVQTLTLSSGTVVREYLSTAGVVFAVSWQGPVLPQLKQLLGASNFAQYVETMSAAQGNGNGRGFAGVNLPGLVVNSGGHMGAFFGKAYLPQSLPAGITPQDIQ